MESEVVPKCVGWMGRKVMVLGYGKGRTFHGDGLHVKDEGSFLQRVD